MQDDELGSPLARGKDSAADDSYDQRSRFTVHPTSRGGSPPGSRQRFTPGKGLRRVEGYAGPAHPPRWHTSRMIVGSPSALGTLPATLCGIAVHPRAPGRHIGNGSPTASGKDGLTIGHHLQAVRFTPGRMGSAAKYIGSPLRAGELPASVFRVQDGSPLTTHRSHARRFTPPRGKDDLDGSVGSPHQHQHGSPQDKLTRASAAHPSARGKDVMRQGHRAVASRGKAHANGSPHRAWAAKTQPRSCSTHPSAHVGRWEGVHVATIVAAHPPHGSYHPVARGKDRFAEVVCGGRFTPPYVGRRALPRFLGRTAVHGRAPRAQHRLTPPRLGRTIIYSHAPLWVYGSPLRAWEGPRHLACGSRSRPAHPSAPGKDGSATPGGGGQTGSPLRAWEGHIMKSST